MNSFLGTSGLLAVLVMLKYNHRLSQLSMMVVVNDTGLPGCKTLPRELAKVKRLLNLIDFCREKIESMKCSSVAQPCSSFIRL